MMQREGGTYKVVLGVHECESSPCKTTAKQEEEVEEEGLSRDGDDGDDEEEDPFSRWFWSWR